MTETFVLKYYIQIHAMTNRTICVCPGSACRKETDCQIKHVQLWTGTVRFQVIMLPESAVNQEGWPYKYACNSGCSIHINDSAYYF